jgi:nitrite reductase/ring-hydroxylating ferredoxin subunit
VPGEYALSRADEMLRCPWHGWEFDPRTGQPWWAPERRRMRTFQAGVVRPGPYAAETFTVAVDQEYVVAEVEQPRGT